jgi:hypothetical protein
LSPPSDCPCLRLLSAARGLLRSPHYTSFPPCAKGFLSHVY